MMTGTSLPALPAALEQTWLDRPTWKRMTPAILILVAIMLLSTFFHLVNITSIGNSNLYYSAAVKSMLQSWHNFFFVAAEPGGSVTVDKPPLGLWIETAFAFFLGVNGFSTSLPNILAGIFGIPLLFSMVRKYVGSLAGLVAAFVMAITPIYVATNRNNTQDGLLVFLLLLAAWSFIQATDNGRLRWLLLGGLIVGLGFNIKMMQALLPLPAFYALYFMGAKTSWGHKIIYLGLTTLVLTVVSLSWAVAVDLIPQDQRPFIGSSSSNTVMSLIIGYNGISRLANGVEPPGSSPQNKEMPPSAPASRMPPGQGQPIPPQPGEFSPIQLESGDPGALRFFISPLSKQVSWILPFALIGLLLAFFGSRVKLPVYAGVHKALILWGGWLLTCFTFFSIISGIFHAYYTIMLAPALGAMIGIGFAQLWSWRANNNKSGVVLTASAVLTIGFQYFAFTQYGESLWWLLGSGILLGLGIILAVMKNHAAYMVLLAAMLVVPLYWTTMTAVSGDNARLPTAYVGSAEMRANVVAPQAPDTVTDEALVSYLLENTLDVKYLAAVASSNQGGAELVLATGRPVLYMGGFSGGDDVVNVEDLRVMVANGELRYVYLLGNTKMEIKKWLSGSCSVVQQFRQMATGDQPPAQHGPETQTATLYVCR